MKPTRILDARSDSDFDTARTLFEEYAKTIGADLCFQGFAEELEQLATVYSPPQGQLLIAWRDGRAVGCVGLRSINEPGVCEMKRLYVRPEARGIGLGKELASAIVERARAGGYRSMVLDTLRSMVEARMIYRSLGFVQRAPHYANPLPDVAFMELRLVETTSETPCTATP
jgi:ribosomal protein S18 acetylase RimI-like enzyme